MSTASFVAQTIAKGVYQVTWSGLTCTVTVGRWAAMPNLPDKTVQVAVLATTAKIRMQGTNKLLTATTITPFTLNDTRGEGNALDFTGPDGRAILENPIAIRPILVSGFITGANSTVIVVAQSTKR